jgi:hypothetical protein
METHIIENRQKPTQIYTNASRDNKKDINTSDHKKILIGISLICDYYHFFTGQLLVHSWSGSSRPVLPAWTIVEDDSAGYQ